MNNSDCVELLEEWKACQQALVWFGNCDPQEAWELCKHACWTRGVYNVVVLIRIG